MFININSEFKTVEKKLVWISLQPTGFISAGFSDQTFISPHFRERHMLWNLYNRATAEYLIADSPKALKKIQNPHLTFHPPNHFHIKQNNSRDKLFEAIAEPLLMLHQDSVVPWIRFVSKPILKLKKATGSRNGTNEITEKIMLDNEDCSLGIGLDFVRNEFDMDGTKTFSKCYDCGQHRIHIFVEKLKPQSTSTLSWCHQF